MGTPKVKSPMVQKSHPKLIRFPAVYSDMDGTFLGKDKQPLSETLTAVSTYQKCRGKFGLATGRTLEQVRPYLTRFGGKVDPKLPLVLFNGGLVVNPKDFSVIYQKNLDAKTLYTIAEKVPSIDGVRTVFVHYVNSTILSRQDERITQYKTRVGIIDTTLCEGDLQTCVAKKAAAGELPVKVMLWADEKEADAVAEKVRATLGDAAVVMVGSDGAIEILPHNVDKYLAIKIVLAQNGLTLDDLVVFGDGGNDVGMLAGISASMAMGNCKSGSCEAAAFKIGEHTTPAIAGVIRRLVMLEGCRTMLPKAK